MADFLPRRIISKYLSSPLSSRPRASNPFRFRRGSFKDYHPKGRKETKWPIDLSSFGEIKSMFLVGALLRFGFVTAWLFHLVACMGAVAVLDVMRSTN
ncbi:unnamed protein product [Lactuca virosa]|uniref:Uncharacterized protein n=1 Tax=Lactuca virosa TaxID=75947 RepID=A0AAU9M059_9ASTR|nr:unnamed protein product [Lactuca virosa]